MMKESNGILTDELFDDIWLKKKGKEVYSREYEELYINSGSIRKLEIIYHKKLYFVFINDFYRDLPRFIKYYLEAQKDIPKDLIEKLEQQAISEAL